MNAAIPAMLPLLVFEAADCLMAIPASEVTTYRKRVDAPFIALDLSEYFAGIESDGPWLHWARDTRSAWLRVRRVLDVVPVALSTLTPMPALLGAPQRTSAFIAAGACGDDLFLLLDPARLRTDRSGEATP